MCMYAYVSDGCMGGPDCRVTIPSPDHHHPPNSAFKCPTPQTNPTDGGPRNPTRCARLTMPFDSPFMIHQVFATGFYEELDFSNEAKNQVKMKELLADSPGVYIPKVLERRRVIPKGPTVCLFMRFHPPTTAPAQLNSSHAHVKHHTHDPTGVSGPQHPAAARQ